MKALFKEHSSLMLELILSCIEVDSLSLFQHLHPMQDTSKSANFTAGL